MKNTVVAFETDRDQIAAIRRVVCELVGARLTVVDSVDQLINALQSETPALMLLPALIPPAQEATLVEFLRTVPEHAHVETLITPILSHPANPVGSDPLWRRLGSRRAPASQMPTTDPAVFAERVVWSLDCVRDRRATAAAMGLDDPHAEAAAAHTESTSTLLVEAPHSLLRMLNDVAEGSSEGRQELMLAEATSRLLQRIERDRRVHRRFAASELPGVRAARIQFGPEVSIIDVSAGGALLESDARLQPESEAMLELIGAGRQLMVPFRVLRCQVTALGQSMRYRGACAFKTPLDVSELLANVAELPSTGSLALPRLAGSNAW